MAIFTSVKEIHTLKIIYIYMQNKISISFHRKVPWKYGCHDNTTHGNWQYPVSGLVVEEIEIQLKSRNKKNETYNIDNNHWTIFDFFWYIFTGGERTRVSANTLVKMTEDSFIASVNYRQIYRYGAFIGDPYFLRLLPLVWGTLRRSFKSW